MPRALRRGLIGFLIAAGVIALFLAIAQDQVTLKLRSAVNASDPRSTGYLAALVASPVSHGDTFDVLRNGDDIFPAMLSAIHEPASGSASKPTSSRTVSSRIGSSPRSSKPAAATSR